MMEDTSEAVKQTLLGKFSKINPLTFEGRGREIIGESQSKGAASMLI